MALKGPSLRNGPLRAIVQDHEGTEVNPRAAGVPTQRELNPIGTLSEERDKASNAHYKRRLRHMAWKWTLHAALLAGVAGSQGPRGPAPPTDLLAQTVRRHRRELRPDRPQRADPLGVPASLWSFNVIGLPTVHIKELLAQAKSRGVAVVLLQSKMCRGHGASEDGGYKLWYSDCTGKKKDGVIVALNKDWTPRDSVFTRMEILPGRILSVRMKSSKLDLTVVSIYAPVDHPNGELKDREMFWDTLNSYLSHMPKRTSPILGGDFNARLGPWATKGVVGDTGRGKKEGREITIAKRR